MQSIFFFASPICFNEDLLIIRKYLCYKHIYISLILFVFGIKATKLVSYRSDLKAYRKISVSTSHVLWEHDTTVKADRQTFLEPVSIPHLEVNKYINLTISIPPPTPSTSSYCPIKIRFSPGNKNMEYVRFICVFLSLFWCFTPVLHRAFCTN